MVRRMPEIRQPTRIADRFGEGVRNHLRVRDAVAERSRAVDEIDARLSVGRGLELPGILLGDNVHIGRVLQDVVVRQQTVSSSG